MRKVSMKLVALGFLLALLVVPIGAQDYRARVQGVVTDQSQAAVPGATVTLINEATGVSAFKVTDATGRYLFDFVEPGTYTVTAELTGFKKSERKGIRVQQRADVAANLSLAMGTLNETVTVVAETTQVQLNSGNQQMTLESQLIDQVPLNGRNPYNLAMLDPTMNPGVGSTANENRPFHHAFANDYDAGGGTRRANDVLLDGVPLNASYKTAYTPSMDAVEEITISKTSADAENGNSLGGIISLNMKSGTNNFKGTAYYFFRDPSLNAVSDPTLAVPAGKEPIPRHQAQDGRRDVRRADPEEQAVHLHVLRAVGRQPTDFHRPHGADGTRARRRLQPVHAQRQGAHDLQPVHLHHRPRHQARRPHPVHGQRDSVEHDRPGVAPKILSEMPQPNVAGNTDNLQYNIYENTRSWNFSERVDWNITDNWKIFARYGQFKANLYQQNPTDAGYFPLSGSNRYGLSAAADSVWVMSSKQTLNIRGSYYNMTDEFYNPSLLLGEEGLQDYWPNNPWYSSLYNSGYVYYPALDVTSGTGTATTNRLGRQGREWYQRPNAWTMSAKMNWYEGKHSMKYGAEVRSYYGQAARFEPINLVFNSTLTANSSDSPDIVNTGNQWASFLMGALDGQTRAILVPLQTPDSRGLRCLFPG